MPYCSGAVATVSAVTFKMPVPSPSSRFTASSYRTPSTSRDRSWRDYGSSSSYVPRSTSYTSSEYKSKHTSRTSSVPSYTRTTSLNDDSTSISATSTSTLRYTTPASSRERSIETRDSGVGYSASTASSRSRDSSKARSDATAAVTTNSSSSAPVERRSSTVSSSITSMADFYSKYSPSNYVANSTDIGRPPLRSYLDSAAQTTDKASSAVGHTSPSSSYVRSRNSAAVAASPEKTTLLSSRLASRSSGGAVGGCSSSVSTPISERRSRLAGTGTGSEDTSVISSSSPRISTLGRTSSSENGGLIGLRNIGNTCFMNSVIQCLSNTRPLLEYLLTDTYLSDLNTSVSSMKGALIKAFSSMIQELWRGDSSERVVNTTSFKSQVQRFAPRFMGYSQQDAQEFLRYLLEGLHEDVNRVTGKPRPILTEIEDTLSDQQKATESWKRYLRMDDSKVVDIFVGQLKSTLRCTSCGHCSVTFDPFWDLSLPIPTRTGQLRLQQCFDHFTKEEVLDGDEKPTCAKCQMRRKCTKSFTIQKFPKILVLHLKRFSPTERFRGKLSVTVDFPLNGLDLSAYAANKGQGSMYNLYGVANHSGTTYSGHYTAYCKHPYTTEWHEYNDSRVSSISTRSIVSGEAYVLFYELSGHSSHL